MSDPERRKREVLADLSELYAEFHEDIKHYYRQNEKLPYAPRDVNTENNLHELLEQTDNVCTRIEAGEYDEARARYERLAELMRETLCEAARFGPRHQLTELRTRRFDRGWVYTITGLGGTVDVETCRETEDRLENLLKQASALNPAEYQECVRKCDRVRTTAEEKLDAVPERNAVLIRLLLVAAAAITLLGTVGTLLGRFA